MSWEDALGYNTVKSEQSQVNGIDQNFWPISVAMAFELRTLAAPLAKAAASLFGSDKQNTGTTSRQVTNVLPQDNGSNINNNTTEYVASAIDPKLAEFRHKQMSEAIEGLFTAFSTPESQEIIARLIFDSLRDVFVRDDKPGQRLDFKAIKVEGSGQKTFVAITPRDFLNKTPLPVMKDFVMGIFKANRRVLGPFGDLVEMKLKQAGVSPSTSGKSEPVGLSPGQIATVENSLNEVLNVTQAPTG